MNHATARTAFAALISALGLTFFVTPAAHAQSSPEVHVTSVERVCGNDTTVYEFRLQNLGGQRRDVRFRVRYGNGFSETFTTSIRRGRGSLERVRLTQGTRATATVRSQGRVILRAPLTGDCRRTI